MTEFKKVDMSIIKIKKEGGKTAYYMIIRHGKNEYHLETTEKRYCFLMTILHGEKNEKN